MSAPLKDINEHSVMLFPRNLYLPEHEEYRKVVKQFIADEVKPNMKKWEMRGRLDVQAFRKASALGIYCRMSIPKEYGGLGYNDFRYHVIVQEELEYADCSSAFFPLGSDIVLPYFTHISTQEQKERWLPRIAKDGLIIAVAMSEPEVGSDLQAVATTAVRDGDDWILNGRKMWISNGALADLVIIVAYSDKSKGAKGLSLFVVEKGTPGFEVVKVVSKLGRPAQDTALLSLKNVRVPHKNLLGIEGRGFAHLMFNLPQERLSIGTAALAAARRVLALTIKYVQGRDAFGRTIGDFQHVAFTLAELVSEVNILQVAADQAILALVQKKCTAEMASIIKYTATELLFKTCDKCLQFYGGYGYLRSNPVGRAFVDSRVTMIYGGANEIMREIVARKLGFQRAGPPVGKKTTPNKADDSTMPKAKL